MKVRNIAKIMVVGVATLASASALAFDFDGVYLLGGVGYAGVNEAQFSDDNNTLVGSGVIGAAGLSDNLEADGNFAWRGGFGAWLTDNFALEFNYFGIAEMDDEKYLNINNGGSQLIGSEAKIEASDMMFFDISGLGRCYLADDLWGFARLGVAWGKVERTFTVDPIAAQKNVNRTVTEDEGGFGASLGIGAQYDFNEMFGLRLEASTIQALNDNDMYAVTGNLVLNFGELM